MRVRRLTAVAAAGIVAAVACLTAQAARPLRTGIYDPAAFGSDAAATAFTRTRAAGATVVRLSVSWGGVAPTVLPETFDPADPEDPAYSWTAVDREVQQADAAGLEPILDVVGAPRWAQTGVQQRGLGPVEPKVADLASFATAVARRYSGQTAGVTRVRYFQLWNEPNLSTNLMPQTATSAATWYRSALNAFAAAVHRVHADNVVIAGGLAPYGIQGKGGPTPSIHGVAPMQFIRTLLCMSGGSKPKPTCATRVDADVWAFHPYTWGGPTHRAFSADDIAIGDIPRAQTLLRAAVRAGHLRPRRSLRFWVTEIGWDSNPPDPKAISTSLQARWTSESLYRLWSDGIQVVTWLLLRDQPLATSPFQSGLYFAGTSLARDRPKPALEAFRFPFVAIQDGDGYNLWGRTPDSRPASVVIELRSGSAWKRVTTLHARAYGIFEGRWASPLRLGYVRARVVSRHDTSIPFGLRPVPDRRISPFGS